MSAVGTAGAAGAAAAFGGVPAATKPAGSMDQNDFLRLMTTQLVTQDPFNPVDNTQMVAQMAQFSQVAGIAEMNASLKALVQGMSADRLADASWIGRQVLVESDTAVPLADGSYSGEVALADGAEQLSISWVDSNGAVVHSENLGARGPGTVPVAWDGKNSTGETVANGPLKMVVTASVGGEAITPATAAWVNVTGIQSPGGGAAAKLLTPLGLLTPEEAIRLA